MGLVIHDLIKYRSAQAKYKPERIHCLFVAPPSSTAVETDVLERPVEKNTARMSGDVVSVDLPAFGQATVRIG